MPPTRRTFTGATALALAAAPSVRASALSTPVASPASSEVPNDVTSRLMALMDTYGVPGGVIAIATPDMPQPAIIELGVANLETGEPISADMHFRIASVTKTFVATVVLQLVHEGLLALEDTIADILPDLDVVNADSVTVQNLLHMRSGLPQLADHPGYIELITSDPAREVTIDQIFGLAIGQPARAEPDTAFDYNNLNFDILGEMIHAVTGSTWHENVQARICEPLGLAHTLMTNTPDLPSPSPRGYGYIDQELPIWQPGATPEATPVPDLAATPVNDAGAYDLTAFNPTVAGAAGGLVSTVRDQIVWANAFATGELISPEMYARQTETLPIDETGFVGYGFGMLDFGGLYAHNGAINGFQSAVAGSPEFGVYMAALTNCYPTIEYADVATLMVLELLNS